MLEDPGVLKIGHDLKSDVLVLARHGIRARSIDDVMLMSYVLDAGLGGHGLDELATRHLDYAPIAFQDIAGKGRTAVAFERVEIARALATRPAYMLLDEPFAGIDPIAVGDIQALVRHLTQRGIGVLITDHNVRETLGLTDRAYIIY